MTPSLIRERTLHVCSPWRSLAGLALLNLMPVGARGADVFRVYPLVAGAFQFEFDNREAAIVATLAPGAYTVILSGADGGSGIGLVEVYDLE